MDDFKYPYVLAARGNGKTFTQMKIYEELLKGENEMFEFMKRAKDIEPIPWMVEDNITDVQKVEQIDIPEPTPKPEEWVWVKGYKGTDRDMCCKGLQYEIGGQRDYISLGEDDGIKLCHSGFHFCRNLKDVFGYYRVGNGNRFFEVEALVRKSDLYHGQDTYFVDPSSVYGRIKYSPYSAHDKLTSKSIRFIRELTVDEVFAAFDEAADCHDWTEDMKKKAMATGLKTVRTDIRCAELVDAGYSQVFAKYICNDYGRYKTAMAVASLDVSMDVKVMAIFLDNQKGEEG